MDSWTSMRLPIPPSVKQHQIEAFFAAETVKFDSLCVQAERAILLLN
jgi:hypothetical protein